MILDTKQMHRDIIKKLNRSMLSQKYLCEQLEIGRSTFWRLSKGHELKVNTFLKLLEWLDRDINIYLKKI